MSSFLSVANQLSATALSQHCRGRERLWRIAWSASSAVKSRAVYCEPRSVWKISPGGGRRDSTAMRSASPTSVVRMWSAIAQPTTRRLARSITVARYNQPSRVRT